MKCFNNNYLKIAGSAASFYKRLFMGVVFTVAVLLTACQTEDEPFTGLRFTADSYYADEEDTITLCASYIKEDKTDTNTDIVYSIITDETSGSYLGNAGTSIIEKSGTQVKLTLGSGSGKIVSVKALCNDIEKSISVSTRCTSISKDDIPTGFAGVDWSSSASEEVEVSTRSALMSAASSGGKVIYITADIDMTDTGSGTMLPSVNYDSVPSTLDDFVNTKTSGAYTTYAAWKKAYGKVSTSVNDKSKNDASSSYYDTMRTLNQAYANIITVKAAKNTTIIGVPDSDGNAPVIKGGRFSVSSNVVIRNLVLQDACDPFTHHEANDGFNAQFDCIAVSGANHVWIDHCTLEDTKKLIYAANGEKWQVYDGLCDITNTSSYVTVSNCIFRNHDKTSLIGNGKTDIYGEKITLACNRFYGCGQRLPLLCYPEVHIYNNYYGDESGFYSNSYAIGARYGAYTIIAEGNYFGSGISNAFNASTNAAGICCAAGNSTNSGTLSTTSSRPFEIPYAYVLLPYSSAKTYVTQTAGAGILSVSK